MAGDAYKGLWNFGEGPEDAFSNAVTSYEDFLKVGSPAYRAEAELACLFAKKAELSSDPGEKTAYEDKQALSSVKAYKAPRMAGEEKAAFVKNYAKGSSDPCAAVLASLWESRNPDQDYSAMLAAVGN